MDELLSEYFGCSASDSVFSPIDDAEDDAEFEAIEERHLAYCLYMAGY